MDKKLPPKSLLIGERNHQSVAPLLRCFLMILWFEKTKSKNMIKNEVHHSCETYLFRQMKQLSDETINQFHIH